jgi:hypothetical protein
VGFSVTGAATVSSAFVLTEEAAEGLLPSDGGFTCVVRYSTACDGTNGQAQIDIEVLDLPNWNVEWIANLAQHEDVQTNTLSGSSSASPIGDAGSAHVAAITMEPGNITGSVDGNAIASVETVSDNSTATHIAVQVLVFIAASATGTATIESLAFYVPVDNAALPGLAA